MLENLESGYDCASASTDLPNLLSELEQLEQAGHAGHSEEQKQQLNRLRNQIDFIRNKCDIPHAHGEQ
ncbi:DUF2524 domain-containing protein [Paenibacillus arenilitoris]|uniref:DUF2524 domain-containing protein n=1 Tax=Paenibacillus arenilitoris TaxID=2772299 RepID=A0A927CPW7_9BACL|nr:DUF2524 domain-containing protein [Paenibacillus arenilitoris]MBD2870081.1 DUF2524 domain-containing protein [Paenibacillus arenilitoris]